MYKVNVHFRLQIPCPAFSLWEALSTDTQMSVAFTRFWLASSTSLLPPACVSSALTSHVTSHRTSEGIPVAGQTSSDFHEASAVTSQWQKNWFSRCTWPRNEAEDRKSGQGGEDRQTLSNNRCVHTIIGKGKSSPRTTRLPATPGSHPSPRWSLAIWSTPESWTGMSHHMAVEGPSSFRWPTLFLCCWKELMSRFPS